MPSEWLVLCGVNLNTVKIRMTTNLEAHLLPLNKADLFLLSSREACPLLAFPDVPAGVHSAPGSWRVGIYCIPKITLSALLFLHASMLYAFWVSACLHSNFDLLLLQEWHSLPLSEIQRVIFYLKVSVASAINITIFLHNSVILFVLKSSLFFL